MPKFLPYLPKPLQDRIEALVERPATKFWQFMLRGRTPTRHASN